MKLDENTTDTKDPGHLFLTLNLPKVVVTWKFFGDNILTIQSTLPINRWKRFWCWFFFGSTFEDIK